MKTLKQNNKRFRNSKNKYKTKHKVYKGAKYNLLTKKNVKNYKKITKLKGGWTIPGWKQVKILYKLPLLFYKQLNYFIIQTPEFKLFSSGDINNFPDTISNNTLVELIYLFIKNPINTNELVEAVLLMMDYKNVGDKEKKFIDENRKQFITLSLTFFDTFIKQNRVFNINRLVTIIQQCRDKNADHFIKLLQLDDVELDFYFPKFNNEKTTEEERVENTKNKLKLNNIIQPKITSIQYLITQILNTFSSKCQEILPKPQSGVEKEELPLFRDIFPKIKKIIAPALEPVETVKTTPVEPAPASAPAPAPAPALTTTLATPAPDPVEPAPVVSTPATAPAPAPEPTQEPAPATATTTGEPEPTVEKAPDTGGSRNNKKFKNKIKKSKKHNKNSSSRKNKNTKKH